MASTTKTTNLELSQFVGTDKPAWLTDYNGDMQKIDDGYKKLEDANAATQADLDATKQDLSGSKTDIDDVKASVQALEAQDIALGNRLTVVEGNYDTMHHEVAINKQSIEDIETDLGMDTPLATTATTVHGAINEHQTFINRTRHTQLHVNANTGSDDNDGLTAAKAMKTIAGALAKYHIGAIDMYLATGEYNLPNELRSINDLTIVPETGATVTVNISTAVLANKLSIRDITLVANQNAIMDIVNFVNKGTILINSGAIVIFINGNLIIDVNGKITGAGKMSIQKCFAAFDASSVIDVANIGYGSSMIMDKGVTITSTINNVNSIISSGLTV